jgi:hypothetical protein
MSTYEDISKDIIEFQFDMSQNWKWHLDKFHDLMRKHKITWGTKDENGHVTGAAPSWSMAYITFESMYKTHLHLKSILSIPEDLVDQDKLEASTKN